MTTLHELTRLSQELVEARLEAAALKDTLEFLARKRDDLQRSMLSVMQQQSMRQYKTDAATISRIAKYTVSVLDESELIAELSSRNLLDRFYVSRLDAAAFKSYAANLLKESGEVLPGTQPKHSEYLSIRSAS